MATRICMGNSDLISWSAFDRFSCLADQENNWCKIKKQLSRLDIWRLMDIRVVMYDHACVKYIQAIFIVSSQSINKLTVMVSEPELEFTDRFWWVDSDIRGWNLSEDTMKIAWIEFEVQKSADADYHIHLVKRSNGRSTRDAKDRAEKIQYKISTKDSVLDLGNGYSIDKNSKFRWQIVKVIVQVPVGKKIRFDESFTRKLEVVKIRIRERRGIDIDVDHWFDYSTSIDYLMTEYGLENPNTTAACSSFIPV